MRASGLVFLVLCATGALAQAALAQNQTDTLAVWLESSGFLVKITGASVAGAEVFHSPDFHQLLVLPDTGDEAYVLGVSSRSVNAVRRSDVTVTAEGAIPAVDGVVRSCPEFQRDGAEISFRCGDRQVQLLPAQPLVGDTDLATLLARKQEYAAAARVYAPDSTAIRAIRACRRPTEIIAFFGTWCGVCKHRMPAFIKIMEVAGNPNLHVRYVCVAPKFSDPRPLIEQYHVHLTPTLVVLRDNAEIGRVDKAPAKSLEQSLADILGGS